MSTIEQTPEVTTLDKPSRGCNAVWCAKYRQTEKGKAAAARAASSRRDRRLAAKADKLSVEQL